MLLAAGILEPFNHPAVTQRQQWWLIRDISADASRPVDDPWLIPSEPQANSQLEHPQDFAMLFPTAEAWDAAESIVSVSPKGKLALAELHAELEEAEEFYVSLNDEAEEAGRLPGDHLANLMRRPPYPVIVISDHTPYADLEEHWVREAQDALQEENEDRETGADYARVIRVPWPGQLGHLLLSDESMNLLPGSVRVCYPESWQALGAKGFLVTPEDIYQDGFRTHGHQDGYGDCWNWNVYRRIRAERNRLGPSLSNEAQLELERQYWEARNFQETLRKLWREREWSDLRTGRQECERD